MQYCTMNNHEIAYDDGLECPACKEYYEVERIYAAMQKILTSEMYEMVYEEICSTEGKKMTGGTK
jgi:hypothetical protein